MKSILHLAGAKTALALVATAICGAALSPNTASAQALTSFTPAGTFAGQFAGNLFESSQNTQNRSAANLFDGTPVVGSNSGNGASVGGTAGPSLFDGYNNSAAAPPANNDYSPVIALNLGLTASISQLGYAQVFIAGNGGKNQAGTINLFTLNLAQYTAHTNANLQAPYAVTPANGTGKLVAPPTAGNYLTTQALTITNTANDNYTIYNLSTPATGQYYVLQFVNSDPTAGANVANFIGGEELRLIGTAVPEPSTWAALLMGTALLGTALRVRRARQS